MLQYLRQNILANNNIFLNEFVERFNKVKVHNLVHSIAIGHQPENSFELHKCSYMQFLT